ncbi:MAG TPA: nuclear transport factor 2 family protein [Solirubrobacterales bacterium]|jgi:ketosteroid isomerase-like protein|nr:nuclear transport factor 2 family protein [Solirubrobacterales bacterium]
MSRANLDTVRRIYEVWDKEGSPVSSGLLDPEIEWVNPPEAVEPGTRRGIEAFADAARTVGETFQGVRVEIERLMDAGERVVVIATLRGRGRGSGADVERRQGYVWTIRAGKAVRFEWFNDPAKAMDAAGLREVPP